MSRHDAPAASNRVCRGLGLLACTNTCACSEWPLQCGRCARPRPIVRPSIQGPPAMGSAGTWRVRPPSRRACTVHRYGLVPNLKLSGLLADSPHQERRKPRGPLLPWGQPAPVRTCNMHRLSGLRAAAGQTLWTLDENPTSSSLFPPNTSSWPLQFCRHHQRTGRRAISFSASFSLPLFSSSSVLFSVSTLSPLLSFSSPFPFSIPARSVLYPLLFGPCFRPRSSPTIPHQ